MSWLRVIINTKKNDRSLQGPYKAMIIPKPGTPKIELQVLPRLKSRLLLGDRISTLDGLKLFGTMRLSEYVRRLRNDYYNVICDMVTDPNTGKRYGVYYIPRTTKKCRI